MDPVNVMLYKKRDFADIIKIPDLKIGKLSWIIRVGPISPREHPPAGGRRGRQKRDGPKGKPERLQT